MRKVLLLLIDGLADVSIPELNNKTPLQAASTPYLDSIAASGLNGLIDPVEPGLACGSDTAHLSLLGYPPERYYRGRGAFESLGAGIEMEDGDVGFKCNFAFMDTTSSIVVHRRVDRNFEQAGGSLCHDLNGLVLDCHPEIEMRVKYATEHRCGIVLHGVGLTDEVRGTDPLKDGYLLQDATPLTSTHEALYTAEVINDASASIRRILEKHPVNLKRIQDGLIPANVVLFRGPGQRIKAPRFEELSGLKACILAPTKIIAGLGMSLGMDIITAPGATGSYDSLISSKAKRICQALDVEGYDFGLLHIKAVDDAGHDKDLPLKVKLLEQVDRMVGQILKRLWLSFLEDRKTVLVVTGDHCTPVHYGDHSNEPVPVALAFPEKTVAVIGVSKVQEINEEEHITANGDLQEVESANCGVKFENKVVDVGDKVASFENKVVSFGDKVVNFDEISAAGGSLGRFPGIELLPLMLQCSQHP